MDIEEMQRMEQQVKDAVQKIKQTSKSSMVAQPIQAMAKTSVVKNTITSIFGRKVSNDISGRRKENSSAIS